MKRKHTTLQRTLRVSLAMVMAVALVVLGLIPPTTSFADGNTNPFVEAPPPADLPSDGSEGEEVPPPEGPPPSVPEEGVDSPALGVPPGEGVDSPAAVPPSGEGIDSPMPAPTPEEGLPTPTPTPTDGVALPTPEPSMTPEPSIDPAALLLTQGQPDLGLTVQVKGNSGGTFKNQGADSYAVNSGEMFLVLITVDQLTQGVRYQNAHLLVPIPAGIDLDKIEVRIPTGDQAFFTGDHETITGEDGTSMLEIPMKDFGMTEMGSASSMVEIGWQYANGVTPNGTQGSIEATLQGDAIDEETGEPLAESCVWSSGDNGATIPEVTAVARGSYTVEKRVTGVYEDNAPVDFANGETATVQYEIVIKNNHGEITNDADTGRLYIEDFTLTDTLSAVLAESGQHKDGWTIGKITPPAGLTVEQTENGFTVTGGEIRWDNAFTLEIQLERKNYTTDYEWALEDGNEGRPTSKITNTATLDYKLYGTEERAEAQDTATVDVGYLEPRPDGESFTFEKKVKVADGQDEQPISLADAYDDYHLPADAKISFSVKGKEYKGADKDIEVGSDGKVTIDGLLPGTYTVTENNGLAEFMDAPTETMTITVDENGNVTATGFGSGPSYTVVNTMTTGSLSFVKYGRKAVSAPANILLEGAVFTLTGNDKTYTATSASTGEVAFFGIQPGTYTLKETKAPDGYTPLAETIEVTIVAGQLETLEKEQVVNTSSLTWLEIRKTFVEYNGATATGKTAQFVLYGADKTTVVTSIGSGETFKVEPGDYYLVEEPVPGYTGEYVAGKQIKVPGVLKNEEGVYIIEVENTSELGELKLVKKYVDAAEKAVKPGGKIVEEVFEIRDADGELYAGDITGSGFTWNKATGRLTLKVANATTTVSLQIAPGKYTITEVDRAGDHFIADKEAKIVTVVAAKAGQEASFTNRQVGNLTITKKGSDDKLLPGAKFGLFRLDGGNWVAVGDVRTTGADGKIVVSASELVEGATYRIVELAPPEGYRLNSEDKGKLHNGTELPTMQEAQKIVGGLEPGDAYAFTAGLVGKEITVINTALSGIYLRKTDTQGNRVGGVVFTLQDEDSATEDIVSVPTDKQGHTGFYKLESGKYTITETSAPEGYVMATGTITVVVGADGKLKASDTEPGEQDYITTGDGYGTKDKPIIVQNVKTGSLTVTKYGDTTFTPGDFTKLLSGATFTLTDAKNQPVKADATAGEGSYAVTADSENAEFTTNEQGVFTISGLLPGDYTLTETEAPEGYLEAVVTEGVKLEAGGSAATTVEDELALHKIRIVKKVFNDKDTDREQDDGEEEVSLDGWDHVNGRYAIFGTYKAAEDALDKTDFSDRLAGQIGDYLYLGTEDGEKNTALSDWLDTSVIEEFWVVELERPYDTEFPANKSDRIQKVTVVGEPNRGIVSVTFINPTHPGIDGEALMQLRLLKLAQVYVGNALTWRPMDGIRYDIYAGATAEGPSLAYLITGTDRDFSDMVGGYGFTKYITINKDNANTVSVNGYTIGEDGVIVGGKYEGYYEMTFTAKETNVPSDYTTDDLTFTVYVKPGEKITYDDYATPPEGLFNEDTGMPTGDLGGKDVHAARNYLNSAWLKLTKADSVTRKPILNSATFDIYLVQADGTEILAKADVKTGNDGTVMVGPLPQGTYIVRETKAPVGYNPLAGNAATITLTNANTTEATAAQVLVKNIATLKLKIQKGYVNNAGTKFDPLYFNLTGDTVSFIVKQGEERVAEVTVNSNGLATLTEGLKDGVYTIHEEGFTKADAQWIGSNEEYEITIEGGKITKVDGVSGGILIAGNGTTFNFPNPALAKIEVKKSVVGADGKPASATGATFGTAAHPRFTLQKEGGDSTTLELTDGMVTFTGLDEGAYTLTEETMAGYKYQTADGNGEIHFTVVKDKKTGNRIIEPAANAGYDATNYISGRTSANGIDFTILNIREEGRLTIVKQDTAGNVLNTIGLDDFRVEIYKEADFNTETLTGSPLVKTVGVGTTTLPVGTYYVVEKTPPKGYGLPTMRYHLVTVKHFRDAGESASVTFQDPKLPTLNFYKVNEEGKAIIGDQQARFELRQLKDSAYEAMATYKDLKLKADGTLSFAGLPEGRYELVETAYPLGFERETAPEEMPRWRFEVRRSGEEFVIVDEDGMVVETEADGIYKITGENESTGKTLTITKSDPDNDGANLAGARFSVYGVYADGTENLLTDDAEIRDGNRVIVDPLPIADQKGVPYVSYRVVETRAPAGYALDDRLHPVSQEAKPTATADGNYVVSFDNSKLRIQVAIDKSVTGVDRGSREELTFESLYDGPVEIDFLLDGLYTEGALNNLPYTAFSVIDSGIEMIGAKGSIGTLTAEDYVITGVQVDDSTYKTEEEDGTTRHARVQLYDGSGRPIGDARETGRIDIAQEENVLAVEVKYLPAEGDGEIGTEFKPGAVTVTALFRQREPDATKYEVLEIHNKARVEAEYLGSRGQTMPLGANSKEVVLTTDSVATEVPVITLTKEIGTGASGEEFKPTQTYDVRLTLTNTDASAALREPAILDLLPEFMSAHRKDDGTADFAIDAPAGVRLRQTIADEKGGILWLFDGELAAGDSIKITLRVDIAQSAYAGSQLLNNAWATSLARQVARPGEKHEEYGLGFRYSGRNIEYSAASEELAGHDAILSAVVGNSDENYMILAFDSIGLVSEGVTSIGKMIREVREGENTAFTGGVIGVGAGSEVQYQVTVKNENKLASADFDHIEIADALPRPGDSFMTGGTRDTEWTGGSFLGEGRIDRVYLETFDEEAGRVVQENLTYTAYYSDQAATLTRSGTTYTTGGDVWPGTSWQEAPSGAIPNGAKSWRVSLDPSFVLRQGERVVVEVTFAVKDRAEIARDGLKGDYGRIGYNTAAFGYTYTGIHSPKINGNEARKVGLYVLPGETEIGDYVWLDRNADGIQQRNEQALAGIPVALQTRDGDGWKTVAETLTDETGRYAFPVLASGAKERHIYRVGFDLSDTDYAITQPRAGGDAALDSDVIRDADDASGQTGFTEPFFVRPGDRDDVYEALYVDDEAAGILQARETFDCGVHGIAGLGDRVWFDRNRNGLQDGGERGVSGVTVTLLDGEGNPVLGDDEQPILATTDDEGEYTFIRLEPGVYSVRFDLSTSDDPLAAVYGPTIADQDGSGAEETVDSREVTGADGIYTITQPVTLTRGDYEPNRDLGLVVPLASLGDRVWHDANRDGGQDEGEVGIAGVEVRLYELRADGDPDVLDDYAHRKTTTTDVDGLYRFDDLDPTSTYRVWFGTPAVHPTQTVYQAAGTIDIDDSDAATQGDFRYYTGPISTLVSGQHDDTYDAGYYTQPRRNDPPPRDDDPPPEDDDPPPDELPPLDIPPVLTTLVDILEDPPPLAAVRSVTLAISDEEVPYSPSSANPFLDIEEDLNPYGPLQRTGELAFDTFVWIGVGWLIAMLGVLLLRGKKKAVPENDA